MIIVTGSTGLIGSATCEYYLNKKINVLGIDNDLRSYFFGKGGSNKWKEKKLKTSKYYKHLSIDIRNKNKIIEIIKGSWREYALTTIWDQRYESLRILCSFDMSPPKKKLSKL